MLLNCLPIILTVWVIYLYTDMHVQYKFPPLSTFTNRYLDMKLFSVIIMLITTMIYDIQLI